jgi:hypothetical protein
MKLRLYRKKEDWAQIVNEVKKQYEDNPKTSIDLKRSA